MTFNTRNPLLDILKLVAALCVIAAHCGFFFEYNDVIYQLSCNGVFRTTIPFFFTVNGFFLHHTFQKKRLTSWLKRVGILYLIWMLIYSYFWITPVYHKPIKIITTLLFGFNHLWYLAALLPGGLLLYYLKHYSNRRLCYLSILLYITGYVIQAVSYFPFLIKYPLLHKLFHFSPLHRNFLFFGVPFLCFGYLIKRAELHQKLKKTVVLKWLFVVTIALLIESMVNYFIYAKAPLNMCLSFLGIGPLLLILAYKFKINLRVNSKSLSLYSIALYLIHPLLIVLLSSYFKLNSVILTLLTILCAFGSSIVLIRINKNIKYLL